MNPFRTKQIRRAILETLVMARGYAIENLTLKEHVNDLLRPPVEHDEWKDAINFLALGEYVSRVSEDADTTLVQWTITARGKTLLASI